MILGDYIEARRRLALSKETIQMMGGESECNEMILGQHEMILLELDYYQTLFKKWLLYFVGPVSMLLAGWMIWMQHYVE